ncbi:type I-G CRISPR-associated RAMP protein Csb1/Cas7g [Mobilicoccus massiliensis]|uniref:type I-G CRISPR-associated RAMP protein Csb1/Cas7g n=1 Tax=Mobilicoccus massiliensis TaxID=1522310 RepID=UPI00069394A2|nr:type I-U CRISPR-associated RAMP protein Csb1/Cas7u [Mobilicoccus massiliensis]
MTLPPRSHLKIRLKPASGDRFQPTGFPDLGAALFRRPVGESDWQECLHVESPQSMANRMEETTWNEATDTQVDTFDGIPYVQVVDADGEFVTASRIEPHRLASAYIMDGTVEETGQTGAQWLPARLGLEASKPLDHRRLARGVYELDPLSLVHGVFFAQKQSDGWPRQPKIARAVTAFIDATDVAPAVSGGVKTDRVDTAGGHADTGYGMVPHHRVEYTAREITAYVTVDHAQLRSYGLTDAETELLEAIIGFELASFFGLGGFRLRTACEFEVVDGGIETDGIELTSLDEATARLRTAIDGARDGLGQMTTVRRGSGKSARSKKVRAETT